MGEIERSDKKAPVERFWAVTEVFCKAYCLILFIALQKTRAIPPRVTKKKSRIKRLFLFVLLPIHFSLFTLLYNEEFFWM